MILGIQFIVRVYINWWCEDRNDRSFIYEENCWYCRHALRNLSSWPHFWMYQEAGRLYQPSFTTSDHKGSGEGIRRKHRTTCSMFQWFLFIELNIFPKLWSMVFYFILSLRIEPWGGGGCWLHTPTPVSRQKPVRTQIPVPILALPAALLPHHPPRLSFSSPPPTQDK